MRKILSIIFFLLFIPSFLLSQSYFEESSKIAFSIYHKVISPVKASVSHCQFYPSCSEFSSQSISLYGFGKGLLLTTDRLMRCSGGHLPDDFYPKNNNNLLLDPPENHTFYGNKDLWIAGLYSSSGSTDFQDSAEIIENLSRNNDSAKDLFGFSKHLFMQEKFDNSILELERISYVNPNDIVIKTKSQLLIGINNLSKNDLESARNIIDGIDSDNEDMQFNKKILLVVIGDLQRTFLWNENFLSSIESRNGEKSHEIYSKFNFYNDLRLGKTGKFINNDSLGFELSKESFDGIINDYQNIKTKSPFVSGMLSALIPGSGYIYAGEVKEGLSAFLVNSLLGAGIYALFKNGNTGSGILTSLVAAPFYLGNIIGSANAAQLSNNRNKEIYFNSLRYRLGIDFYFSRNYFLMLW